MLDKPISHKSPNNNKVPLVIHCEGEIKVCLEIPKFKNQFNGLGTMLELVIGLERAIDVVVVGVVVWFGNYVRTCITTITQSIDVVVVWFGN